VQRSNSYCTSAAGNGETPANVHVHDTVHLSTVAHGHRSPCPRLPDELEHIFGDFPSFDDGGLTLTVLCYYFDGVKRSVTYDTRFYLLMCVRMHHLGRVLGRNDHPSGELCANTM